MFNKWSINMVKRRANLKTSLANKLKESAIKSIPRLEEIIDEVFPKKKPVIIHHLGDHVTMYSVDGQPILVQLGDGTIFPFLKLPIEYPGLLRSVYCYDEAVCALIRGADLMARGTWGVDDTFQVGEIVQVCLMGEKTPFAVGMMTMPGEEILERNDGGAVKVFHILKDGLWEAKSV
ncbi:Translation machinery-associated protein 20 [Tritrichomonas foetus]|uniref:Translation machinery-associated protein 20 n=1 Tax=Tritrichomonas foetus TaxID=1144522 RepID=A0A1J4JER2_9EUKA|nr:Translation machinery-associated protein 20 [Tritrichomonas foetus]|eukprot:OHS97600.1 Translation machinery-associated protein 20 [Tritrichomonas foetus]